MSQRGGEPRRWCYSQVFYGIFTNSVMRERTTPELSSRPEHDGFIVMRSGETCRLQSVMRILVARSASRPAVCGLSA